MCVAQDKSGVVEITAQRNLAELGQLVRLAGPLVFTQLAQMGMGVVDTVMAGRLGAVNLAGVALGGVVFWPLLLLVAGIVMALTPTVSQLHGSGRSHEAGEAVGGSAHRRERQAVEPLSRKSDIKIQNQNLDHFGTTGYFSCLRDPF